MGRLDRGRNALHLQLQLADLAQRSLGMKQVSNEPYNKESNSGRAQAQLASNPSMANAGA
jgi:hypothetical protein